MGCGKSNALKGMYFALTNDTSRNEGLKAANVRQGSGGEEAYVLLEGEHEGGSFEIRRSLVPSRSQLVLNGEKFVKETEVRVQLDRALGLSRRLIDEFVFVDQWEVANFLSQIPSVRVEALQHLCGTIHLEQLRQKLQEQLNADSVLAVAPSLVDRNQAKIRYEAAKGLAQKLWAELKKKKKRLPTPERLQSYQADVRLYDQYLRQTLEKQSLGLEIDKQSDRNKDALKAQAKAVSEVEDLAKKCQKSKEGAAKAGLYLSQIEALFSRNRDIDASKAELTQVEEELVKTFKPIKPEVPSLPFAWDTLQDLRNQAAEYNVNLRTYTQMLEGTKKDKCPTCGAALTPKWRQENETRRNEGGAVLVEIEQAISALSRYEAGAVEYEGRLAKLEARRIALQSLLKKLGPRAKVSKEDRAEARAKVQQLQTLEERHAVAQKVWVRASSDAASTSATLESSVASLRKVMSFLKEHEGLPERAKNSVKSLERCGQLEKDVHRLEVEMASAKTTYQEAKVTYRHIVKTRRQAALAQKWVEDLKALREILHRDALPKLIHQTTLEDVEEAINQTLEKFEAPFRVQADEGLSFKATFVDGSGRVQPAERLSGGQKVVLAIAFRLAVHSHFASRVGMMVLDEPTAGLDEECVGHVGEIFGKLGREARVRGMQILVVTHDRRLESFFDRVIRLESEVSGAEVGV